jgi:hypothetical protein
MNFSITNIDRSDGGLDPHAIMAFFRIKEDGPISFEFDGASAKCEVQEDYNIKLELVKDALAYQPDGRYLVDYVGYSRHIKVVYLGDAILGWASYDVSSNQDGRSFFSRSIVPLSDCASDTRPMKIATIEGLKSGRKIELFNPSRKYLLELAKHGSRFNKERVEIEIKSSNRYDAVTFFDGKVQEKRGVNYHPGYQSTIAWLSF